MLRVFGCLIAFFALSSGWLSAQTCTVVVDSTVPGATIQAAVNAASPGAVICLKGTFSEAVTINKSYLTIRSAPGETAVLDGTSLGINHDAFTLEDGVSHITIEGLEIKSYGGGSSCCGWGNAIQAWDVNTSYVTIRNNYMHDNNWNGVLVGSEGRYAHTGWAVHDNRAENNGFAQIELTNCSGCSIHRNTVVGNTTNALGILVQARNTERTDGPFEMQGVSIQGNSITGCSGGYYDICLYTYVHLPSVTSTVLKPVSIVQNTIVDGRRGIYLWGLGGPIVNASIVSNRITCSGPYSRGVVVAPTSINTKVVNNSIDSSCAVSVRDLGEDTKIPPSRSKK